MNTSAAGNILRDYLHVQDGPATAVLPGGDAFWQALAGGAYPQLAQGRLMSAFSFTGPWASWERHPQGEELVLLLAGEAVLVLETGHGEQQVTLLEVGDFFLIPAGVWHTARTQEPTTLLFLTPGDGTEHRPV